MATTIQAPNIFNVQATMNASFITQLTAITRPAWLTALPAMNQIWPETGIAPPAFSFTHIDVGAGDMWEGREVGGGLSGLRKEALFDVGCWVTRKENNQWNMQLRTMQDMVYTVVVMTPQLVIKDYVTSLTSPSDTSYLVRLGSVVTVNTVPDEGNPDIERVRILIAYSWVYRSS